MSANVAISIITPCLNGGATLRESIESVIKQNNNVEHIIVDGGSTDDTLSIISEYPYIKLINLPGSSVYEAINAGIFASKGHVIGHLNSDDIYPKNAFAIVLEAFAEDDIDIICGGAEMFRVHNNRHKTIARINGHSVKKLSPENVIQGVPIINAKFFLRKVYSRIGFYSEEFRIVSDKDLLLRACSIGLHTKVVNQVLYEYRMHENSLTLSGAMSENILKENRVAAKVGIEGNENNALLRKFYKLWFSWGSGYIAINYLKTRQFREAFFVFKDSSKTYKLWPLHFCKQCISHILTAKDRRWSD